MSGWDDEDVWKQLIKDKKLSDLLKQNQTAIKRFNKGLTFGAAAIAVILANRNKSKGPSTKDIMRQLRMHSIEASDYRKQ